jgi:hypothetical protein
MIILESPVVKNVYFYNKDEVMKKLLVILLCCFSTLSLFAQYLGDDGYWYNAHDIDILLSNKIPGDPYYAGYGGWDGTNYRDWRGCSWVGQGTIVNPYSIGAIGFSYIDQPQCTNNEEIKINIIGSADITKMSLLIQGEYENIYMETKEGSSNEFTYVVPESALGYKKLLAIGYTDSQTAVVDTASINVSTSASLLYIDTDEKELWLPLTGKQSVYVNGLYSDGTYKNITFMDDVRFEIKGNNAGLESPNIITGEKAGVDTLLISCQGFETALPIRIVEVEDRSTSIVSPDITEKAETQTLKCYPNPAREQVIIQYELPEQASSVTISVYDIKGQIINKIQPQNRKAGLCEEIIQTGNFSKGMYIVVLSTDKGNRYAKLLKE